MPATATAREYQPFRWSRSASSITVSRPSWRMTSGFGRLPLAEAGDADALPRGRSAHGRTRGRRRAQGPRCRGERGFRRVRRPGSSCEGTACPRPGCRPLTLVGRRRERHRAARMRARGLEPPRPGPPAPKAGASTSSATPARAGILRGLAVAVAQLVVAPGCGPGGRGFESHRSPLSRPVPPAPVAQGIEQQTSNLCVARSNRAGRIHRNPNLGAGLRAVSARSANFADMTYNVLFRPVWTPDWPRTGP